MKTQFDNLQAAGVLFSDSANSGRFSDELNRLIADGKVTLKNTSMFIKKDITGGAGTQNIIDANTKKEDGVCSFRGNELPKNQAFLLTHVSVSYADGDAAKMGDSKFNTTLPGALRNAVLSIRQRGEVILERPVSDLSAPANATKPEDQMLALSIPAFLRDDDNIEMTITFPKGSSVPAVTGKANLAAFKFWGVSTSRKA